MAVDQERQVEISVDALLGLNTASQPTGLQKGQFRVMKNSYQKKLGSDAKRPGSAPVTETPLSADINYLTEYQFVNSVEVGLAPTLSAVAGTATLPTDTYYVRYTYVTDSGETEASPEASQAITLTEDLHIVIPAIPFHANSINIYISNATNTETLQANVTTTTYDQTELLVVGASYPTSNTTSFASELLGASSTSLYSYYGTEFHTATMTAPLNTSDIYSIAFTDANSVSILFITDGAAVKQYDGSAVTLITPAADDPSPAPPNALADINLLGPRYCWVHKSQIFVSTGNDTIYYSTPFLYDYFPSVQFERFVRNNDYITGPGVTYSDALMIPMRRGWGLLTGNDFDDFVGNQFLNTVNGCIAARSIQRVTYPSGAQTIFYLSDDGVYEIFDTGAIDSGSRQYATRSKMSDHIDFNVVGFTDAEKMAASSYYDQSSNLYILLIKRDTESYAYCMDVRNGEFYLWTNIRGNDITKFKNVLYFAGVDKLLFKFDETLADDFYDFDRTTFDPVDWDLYTDLLAMEDTGYQSYLDYLIVWAKQQSTSSSIDVTVVFASTTQTMLSAVQSTFATWDLSLWDFAVFANLDYSDLVGAPPRIIFKRKAFFFQIRFQNNRSELVELHRYKMIGRTSGG